MPAQAQTSQGCPALPWQGLARALKGLMQAARALQRQCRASQGAAITSSLAAGSQVLHRVCLCGVTTIVDCETVCSSSNWGSLNRRGSLLQPRQMKPVACTDNRQCDCVAASGTGTAAHKLNTNAHAAQHSSAHCQQLQATAALSRGGIALDVLVMRLCLERPFATVCAGPRICKPCCPHPIPHLSPPCRLLWFTC